MKFLPRAVVKIRHSRDSGNPEDVRQIRTLESRLRSIEGPFLLFAKNYVS